MYFGYLSAHAWLGCRRLARRRQMVQRLSVGLLFLALGFLHSALLLAYLLLDPLFLVTDLRKMRHVHLALRQRCRVGPADVASALAQGAASLTRALHRHILSLHRALLVASMHRVRLRRIVRVVVALHAGPMPPERQRPRLLILILGKVVPLLAHIVEVDILLATLVPASLLLRCPIHWYLVVLLVSIIVIVSIH